MALPVHDWVREFSTLAGVIPKTAERLTVTLQNAGLFPRPRQGNAAWRTRVGAPDLTNFFLGIASPTFADVANTVARLRAMRFAGALGETPYLDAAADFGELMDGLIAGSRGDGPPNKPGLYAPSVIAVSAEPDNAELLWLGRNGSVERRNIYGTPLEMPGVIKRVVIPASLIELAARASAPEMGAARPLEAEAALARNPPAALATARGRGAA